MHLPSIVTFALLSVASSAHAIGVCPTKEVMGKYVVRSMTCSREVDPRSTMPSELKGLIVRPDTGWGVDARIDFVGWSMGWGIYQNSRGGESEICENSETIKRIQRKWSTSYQIVHFKPNGAEMIWPIANGVCSWELVKQL